MNKKKSALILGIVCFLLTAAIMIQINTIENATKNIGSTLRDSSNLKDELLKTQMEYRGLYKQTETLEKKLELSRQNATKNDETDLKIEEEIKENQKLLGLTNLSGQGLIIQVDDNRDINSKDVLNISDYLVHQGDLIYIVNELFNAGADAISINGQRIVSTTSILCDGNIIRINGKMVGVPITIKAIGYPERLYYALVRPGSYLECMANDGVNVYVEKSEKLEIPKYTGVYNGEHLSRGEE